MQFTILREHRDYFQKHGYVEFDDLLRKEEIEELNLALDQVLSLRLKVSSEGLKSCSIEEIIMAGRDARFESDCIKKNACKLRLAKTASQLMEIRPLRLAYDQALVSRLGLSFSRFTNPVVARLFENKTFTLREMSGFQGRLCGIMLCLKGPKGGISAEKELLEGNGIFSKKSGNGIYFDGNAPISFSFLMSDPFSRYLLVVYAEKKTFYALKDADPHAHFLKRYGYVFGDRLREEFHPTLYR